MFSQRKKEKERELDKMEEQLRELKDKEFDLEEEGINLHIHADEEDDINSSLNDIGKRSAQLNKEILKLENELESQYKALLEWENNVAENSLQVLHDLTIAAKKYYEHLKPDLIKVLEQLPLETLNKYLAKKPIYHFDLIINITKGKKIYEIDSLLLIRNENFSDFEQQQDLLKKLKHTVKLYDCLQKYLVFKTKTLKDVDHLLTYIAEDDTAKAELCSQRRFSTKLANHASQLFNLPSYPADGEILYKQIRDTISHIDKLAYKSSKKSKSSTSKPSLRKK
jgi:hypothetical protein